MDNRVISRKIIDVKYLSTDFNPDIAVVRLESDLPGSISPMKVLASNAENYVTLFSPVLRIDQESKALIVQASPSGIQEITLDPSWNPPGAAFQLYYEDMISDDSSSPSILLMNTSNGVMPILYGLVTYSGRGTGPRMSTLVSQLQTAIQGFGDTHQIVTAPTPASSVAAPSCSIAASRISNSASCSLIVTGSADPVTGNPTVTPSAPSAWTKAGNVWTGNAACATNAMTTFTATLTGPGGTGRSCESALISPVEALPGCTVAAKRKDLTDTCELTVAQTSGKNASKITVSPTTPATWTTASATWTGSVTCAKASSLRFTASLESSDGKGPECISKEVPKTSGAPGCTLSLSRIGNSNTCNYTLTRTSPPGTISSFSILGSAVNWDGSSPSTNTASCSQTSDTAITANVNGPDGSTTCTASVPKLTPPSCVLTATRQTTTASCSVSLSGSGVIDTSKQPLLTLTATGSWAGNNWTGTGVCPTDTNTTFSASIEGPGGSKSTCQSNTVGAVPQPPSRSCNANAARASTPCYCSLSISITGEIIGSPSVSPYSPSSWSRSGNVWSPIVSCPTNRDTIYSINLTGPGNNYWGCGSNKVSAISK